MGSQAHPSKAGRVRAWVLSGLSRLCEWISLEHRPMRVRHRYRFPPTGGPAGCIYENLARTAIHTVKPDHIATFLGRKLSTQFEGEWGTVSTSASKERGS